MTDLSSIRHPEHMTEDELGLHAEQLHIDIALLRHQQAHAPTLRPSLSFCVLCGNPIPPARQQAVPGVDTCVDCQRDEEFRERYR